MQFFPLVLTSWYCYGVRACPMQLVNWFFEYILYENFIVKWCKSEVDLSIYADLRKWLSLIGWLAPMVLFK